MTDLLFEQFANPINLRQAFKYVKSEVERSSLPLDPFWVPGINAVETLGDAFFNSLSKTLLDGSYTPEESCVFPQLKQNFGIRRLAMITVIDRIVYQALLNQEILGNQLTQNLSELCLYPGVSHTSDHYLKGYKEGYEDFWKIQRYYFDERDMVCRGEYDVHAFYDNISHFVLGEMLIRDGIGTNRINELLFKLLSTWHRSGRGIPQGPDASSVIANYYLSEVDKTFGDSEGSIGYVRYMDDMILMSSSKNQLFRAIERLTETLDQLELNLNSKTKIEMIETSDFFDDKGIEHTYLDNESFNDWTHTENARVKSEKSLDKLARGIELEKSEFSSLKYYLKASNEYSFARMILPFYSELPALSDLIVQYVQPFSSEDWVQTSVIKMIQENHLFRWQKLWLAKLILVEQSRDSSTYPQFNFYKSDRWELRSMAWLSHSITDPYAISPKELTELIDRSENIFELGLYVAIASYALPDTKIDNRLRLLSDHKSQEVRMLVCARMLNREQLDQVAIDGTLFSATTIPKGNQPRPSNPQTVSVEKILGLASKTSDPKTRYPFEIQIVGDDIVMYGSLLCGRSVSIFNSTRPSALFNFLKELLIRHQVYNSEIYQDYLKTDLENIACDGEVVDLVKSRRNLKPLCAILIKYLIIENRNKISFHRAISSPDFEKIPSETIKKIHDFAEVI